MLVQKVLFLLESSCRCCRQQMPAYIPSAHGGRALYLPLPMRMLSLRKIACWQHPHPRRQWHPTPILLPGKSHGWRSLVGCSGVAKSRTRLSDFTFTFHFHALEKEMATHSSVLAQRIPGMGEPGGMPSMGSHRVGHD